MLVEGTLGRGSNWVVVVLCFTRSSNQNNLSFVGFGLDCGKFSPQGDLEGDAQVLVVHLLEVDLDVNVVLHLLDVPQVQLSLHFQRLPLRFLVILKDQII